MNSAGKRGCVVAAYAVAMAWLEATVVLYLRRLFHRIEPFQPDPLVGPADLAIAELIREVATLVMLACVGWLAGRHARDRFGYALIAFGVWDIFYYVFLRVLTGWPRSLGDWDILFLIPLPWWGPVIAPTLIALLMIWFGALVSRDPGPGTPPWPRPWAVGLATLGVLLAMYVFMADALRVADRGTDALRRMLPTEFPWPLFLTALLLMACPIGDLLRQPRPATRGHAPPTRDGAPAL